MIIGIIIRTNGCYTLRFYSASAVDFIAGPPQKTTTVARAHLVYVTDSIALVNGAMSKYV